MEQRIQGKLSSVWKRKRDGIKKKILASALNCHREVLQCSYSGGKNDENPWQSCKYRAFFFLASKTQFDLIMFARFIWMDAEHNKHQQKRLLLLLSTPDLTIWFVHLLHFLETADTSVYSFQICSLGWRSGLWGGSVHLFSVVADSFAAGSCSNS